MGKLKRQPGRVLPWTWTKEGMQFHALTKPRIMEYVYGLVKFTELSKLTVMKAWRVCGVDDMQPNVGVLVKARDEFLKSDVYKSKEISIPVKLIARTLSDFVVALLHGDEMYYERGVWCINRFLERSDRWMSGGVVERLAIIREIEVMYFENEKREDRLPYMKSIWLRFVSDYETKNDLRIILDWWGDWLCQHRELWNPKELSRLGLEVDNAGNWYPIGRGKVWNMIHGGKG